MRTLLSQPDRSPISSAPIALAGLVTVVIIGMVFWSGYRNSHHNIFDAVRLEELERLRALVRDHPDLVFSKDSDGWTPLHWAARWHQGSATKKDIVELLLAHGADVNARNRFGQTPLHMAVGSGFGFVDCACQTDVAELLLAHGADVNARPVVSPAPFDDSMESSNRHHFGQPPLQWAAAAHCVGVVKSLLVHGADVNVKARTGGRAIDRDHDQGANLDAKDNFGNTPLSFASGSAIVREVDLRPVEHYGNKDTADYLSKYKYFHKK